MTTIAGTTLLARQNLRRDRILAPVWVVVLVLLSYASAAATPGLYRTTADQVRADGKVYDLDRIMYLRNYLMQLQRAVAEGVPVRGYFLWSLMDNFEWIYGFEKRFGLYHVDFDTLARTAKLSASFYRSVIARNAVDI